MAIRNSSTNTSKTEMVTKVKPPPSVVKNIGDLILWEYAKLIARAAGFDKNYGFTMSRFLKLKNGEIDPSNLSNVDKDDRVAMTRRGGKCVYCGTTEDLTIDHIIPLIRGGQNITRNEVPCCKTCNSSKGNKDLYEWYYLIKNDHEIPKLVLSKYLKLVRELLGSERKLDRFDLNGDGELNVLDLGYSFKTYKEKR